MNEVQGFLFKGGKGTVTTRASLIGCALQDNAKKNSHLPDEHQPFPFDAWKFAHFLTESPRSG
jgi:hypothetical protein